MVHTTKTRISYLRREENLPILQGLREIFEDYPTVMHYSIFPSGVGNHHLERTLSHYLRVGGKTAGVELSIDEDRLLIQLYIIDRFYGSAVWTHLDSYSRSMSDPGICEFIRSMIGPPFTWSFSFLRPFISRFLAPIGHELNP